MKRISESVIISAAVLLTLCSFASCSASQDKLLDDPALQVQAAIEDTDEEIADDADMPDNTEDEDTFREEPDSQIQEWDELTDAESEGAPEPAVINYDNYAGDIDHLINDGIMVSSPDESYEWAVSNGDDFAEASEKYVKLLESFMDSPENYKLFCGGYYQNGYLHLMMTDKEKKDIFLDVTGSENVIIKEGDYSYTYLTQLYELIDSLDFYEGDDRAGKYFVNKGKDRVEFVASSEEMEESVYAAVEAGGYDKNAVEITIGDFVYANPL